MSEFVITIDEAVMESAGSGAMGLSRVDELMQRIVAKAKELLQDNLPPWPIVEAAVKTAYDTYIRPLAIPNFIDNILSAALVREVKKLYDQLA